ncbi:MAG: hypothetical protein DRJ30_04180 [Candidatus Methanomethylicota archaeon]|nr:MAG: hypothetical protein DRJ30_04180 [Candidatus Verstraetearchaeota archaeon]
MRGELAGWFSQLFKRSDCNQTKCIAMGDPYCQFKVKPKSS